MAVTKKLKKQIEEQYARILTQAERQVGSELGGLSGASVNSLEELKKQYETVNVKIKKKNRDGKMSFFTALDNQNPKMLIETGLDSMCMEQGGGGDYEVWIQPPNRPSVKYWSGSIMGTSYEVSKKERDRALHNNPFGALLPHGPAGMQTPAMPMAAGGINLPDSYFQGTAHLAKQAESSGDRMMAMMMNQAAMQQQASDRQMQMLAMMFQGKSKDGPSESAVSYTHLTLPTN